MALKSYLSLSNYGKKIINAGRCSVKVLEGKKAFRTELIDALNYAFEHGHNLESHHTAI